MIEYLLTKDSKGKFRFAIVESDEEWHEPKHGYLIQRSYGQVGGKTTLSPPIIVDRTKQKRTWKEQLKLQFNSTAKGYLDKGYIKVEKHPNEYTIEELQSIFGNIKTNQHGVIKPMLAKSYKDIKTKGIFDKDYYASVKINGVRCLMFWKDNEIHTASRGATNYDLATYHINTHPKLVEFFKVHPDIILDGELFTWGETLNKISGTCRSQATVAESEYINYYIYDVIELGKSFTERLETLKNIKKELDLEWLDPFNPKTDWKSDDLKILMVPHTEITGWDKMKSLHDQYVQAGWEGLVIRNADSEYKPGTRTNAWIKIKVYIDAEYPIVGMKEGLRDEDMCFVCQTPKGYEFAVKPIGTREQKYEYIKNINSIIGKQLTIKYFEMSGAGTDIPQQPVGICIRDYE